jgi:acyl carrier protein
MWVEEKVKKTLSRALGLASNQEIPQDVSFADLGLDSLTGIEFIDALNRQWNVKLSSSLVYDQATVAGIATSLFERLDVAGDLISVKSADPPAPPTHDDRSHLYDPPMPLDLDGGLQNLLGELSQWK